jgi:3-hydroxyacyl-CoA dehydrogenase/enoyl-CoA hydratase/3-hydroxybutyryl-CoA epimerase
MINYNVDSDGIATITWDMPNRAMNVLNEASMTAYAGALETALKDEKVKGIIITSGKDSFIAGADLEMILSLDTSDASKLMEQFSQLQKMFRRQETGGKPIVAAINGTALGGGFEICLATHYRIAAANPKTKVGQPEVKIGLLPGGGGTQRIPRLIGVQNAAPILLEGKDLTVDAAKGLGLIHEVVPAGELLARAKAWLTAPATEQVVPEYAGKGAKAIDGRAVQPWDRKGFKVPGFPGGQVWSPPGVMTFIGGSAMVRGKTNHELRLRRPAASDRCRPQGRDALLRLAAARSRRQEHDPHAVLRPAGSQQAGAPAEGRAEAGVQEDRRAGRRPDGCRHRHRLGAGRPRHRADRP